MPPPPRMRRPGLTFRSGRAQLVPCLLLHPQSLLTAAPSQPSGPRALHSAASPPFLSFCSIIPPVLPAVSAERWCCYNRCVCDRSRVGQAMVVVAACDSQGLRWRACLAASLPPQRAPSPPSVRPQLQLPTVPRSRHVGCRRHSWGGGGGRGEGCCVSGTSQPLFRRESLAAQASAAAGSPTATHRMREIPSRRSSSHCRR